MSEEETWTSQDKKINESERKLTRLEIKMEKPLIAQTSESLFRKLRNK